MSKTTLLGVYKSGTQAAAAISAVREKQLGVADAYSPTADASILGARPRSASAVRLFTLLGGIVGGVIGVAFPMYTMTTWPLIVGGKPPLSFPPLVIIGFELMMLGAALSGFIGFLVMSRLPRLQGGSPIDRRFTDDMFGVLVTCEIENHAEVLVCLERSGTSEVIDGG